MGSSESGNGQSSIEEISKRHPRTPPTLAERQARGKAARAQAPRSSHADWAPAADRRDPVDILEEQSTTRIQSLVPIRYGRMLESPFAFYRGGAAIMAADVAPTPVTDINVQVCGDGHVSNFGVFGSPERDVVFDVNDFDETLQGPWEWEVKRFAASVVIVGRENGFSSQEQHDSAKAAVRAYREAMRNFAQKGNLDVWYASLTEDQILQAMPKKARKRGQKRFAKARRNDSLRAVSKLTEIQDGRRRISYEPPLLVPLSSAFGDADADRLYDGLVRFFTSYNESLRPHLRYLVNEYTLVDIALKVVGVGSVGTRAFIVLLQGRDEEDYLFLQSKEAQQSVLAPYIETQKYSHQGRRVVEGQRQMQTVSDIFLGWGEGDETDYYFRQFRNMKGSVDLSTATPASMDFYTNACGWTLARAHAHSGDRVAIASYLGKGEVFDEAIADFAVTYADQNERDHEALAAAVATGRIEANTDE